jgi:hypothetical protein
MHKKELVVQNVFQMGQEHLGQLLHGFESLPAQLIHPALQIIDSPA